MDLLDRIEERKERLRNLHDEEPETQPPSPVQHDITIIGCIRGVDGWYRCGFDENTKTIVPVELLEKSEADQ